MWDVIVHRWFSIGWHRVEWRRDTSIHFVVCYLSGQLKQVWMLNPADSNRKRYLLKQSRTFWLSVVLIISRRHRQHCRWRIWHLYTARRWHLRTNFLVGWLFDLFIQTLTGGCGMEKDGGTAAYLCPGAIQSFEENGLDWTAEDCRLDEDDITLLGDDGRLYITSGLLVQSDPPCK